MAYVVRRSSGSTGRKGDGPKPRSQPNGTRIQSPRPKYDRITIERRDSRSSRDPAALVEFWCERTVAAEKRRDSVGDRVKAGQTSHRFLFVFHKQLTKIEENSLGLMEAGRAEQLHPDTIRPRHWKKTSTKKKAKPGRGRGCEKRCFHLMFP